VGRLVKRNSIQSRPRQFHSGQTLDRGAGLSNGHFTANQGRHLLHRGRSGAAIFNPQHFIGWKLPPLAPFAPASHPLDLDRPKAGLDHSRVFDRLSSAQLPQPQFAPKSRVRRAISSSIWPSV
jgi:hypothetical protein